MYDERKTGYVYEGLKFNRKGVGGKGYALRKQCIVRTRKERSIKLYIRCLSENMKLRFRIMFFNYRDCVE